MSDSIKYYYLKLKEDFFSSDAMIVLENLQDGYKYSNILLKLYLKSLKDEGRLMLNGRIPYNTKTLAQVTNHSVGDVELAIKAFEELGLVEILDNGAIYMLDIQNFIGRSSTEADRIRNYRSRIEAEKTNELPEGVQMYNKSTPEIEIEIEKELELPAAERMDYKHITELYHSNCPGLPKVRDLTDNRKKALKAWGDMDEMAEVFEKVGKSKFLNGDNDRKWKADFDWIIKPANRVKILEDKYSKGDHSEEPQRKYKVLS